MRSLSIHANHRIEIDQSHLWTTTDVARQYQVSERTVANWVSGRRVPYLKINRAVRFIPENVKKALGAFEVRAIEIRKTPET